MLKAETSLKQDCQARKQTGEMIQNLLKRQFKFYDGVVEPPKGLLWSTNIHANGHPKIQGKDIDMDRKCQLVAAKKYGIPVLDIYSIIPKQSIEPAGFHVLDSGKAQLVHELMMRVARTCLYSKPKKKQQPR